MPSAITYTAPCPRCGQLARWSSAVVTGGVNNYRVSGCACETAEHRDDEPADEGGERPDMPGWAWLMRARRWVTA